MKRFSTKLIALFALVVLFVGAAPAASADEIEIVDIVPVVTPTPVPIPVPTPVPTPTPDPAKLPHYAYDEADARCLSRAIWSVTPMNPTWETKVAFCEVVQNRVDDDSGVFEDDIRHVLLQGNEFMDYDPDANRSPRNNEIADYVMRTWIHAKNGDRSYRLVPASGVKCSFYEIAGKDYIKIYDMSGNTVYDSGEDQR